MTKNKENNRELTITRVFDAPREKVWEAWTNPEELEKWWGPRGVTNPTCVWEAKEGGAIHIVMLAGKELGELAGQEWPMKGFVMEVVEPKKLEFTSEAIMGGKPILENIVALTLDDEVEKTKMNLHVLVTKAEPEAEGALSGMKQGWTESIDKLGELLMGR